MVHTHDVLLLALVCFATGLKIGEETSSMATTELTCSDPPTYNTAMTTDQMCSGGAMYMSNDYLADEAACRSRCASQTQYYNPDHCCQWGSNRRCSIHESDVLKVGVGYHAALCDAAGGASGDPHMTNVKNEHFDIMAAGIHTLLQVPRFATPENTLLRVEGNVRHFSGCRTQYIKHLNMTGSWVTAVSPGGIDFDADRPNSFSMNKKHQGTKTLHVGPATLRVEYHISKKGLTFLNFFATSLGNFTGALGGLLGVDDHTYATQPNCKFPVLNQLKTEDEKDAVAEDEGSFAAASLA